MATRGEAGHGVIPELQEERMLSASAEQNAHSVATGVLGWGFVLVINGCVLLCQGPVRGFGSAD